MRGIGKSAAHWGVRTLCLLVFGFGAVLPAFSTGRPDGQQAGWSPRFQLELYGGLGQAGLSDLNSLAGYDNGIQEFLYDRLFDYQRRTGLIAGWDKSLTGARGTIGLSFPLGLRVRMKLSEPLAVSLGVRLSCARRGSDYTYVYTRDYLDGYKDRETVAYSPYLLSAKSLVVLAGVHFAKPVYRRLTLEAFLAAGPVFADCDYTSSWEYTWHKSGNGMDWDVSHLTGLLEEKGRGRGFAADLGARVQCPVGKKLAVFLEGAYTAQAVKTIKGKGREVRGEVETGWEGSWAFKKETISAPWGTLETEFPTNYWPEGSAASRVRKFGLNFSGLQARIGLAFLF